VLGYRAHSTVSQDRESIVGLSLGQLYSWLRSKGYRADDMEPDRLTTLADGVQGPLVALHDHDGSQSVRARIAQEMGRGSWTSELTLYVPGQAQRPASILRDILSPDRDPQDRSWTGTHQLARRLLDVLDARDSEVYLRDKPMRVGLDDTSRWHVLLGNRPNHSQNAPPKRKPGQG
jgi:hypothetical protein